MPPGAHGLTRETRSCSQASCASTCLSTARGEGADISTLFSLGHRGVRDSANLSGRLSEPSRAGQLQRRVSEPAQEVPHRPTCGPPRVTAHPESQPSLFPKLITQAFAAHHTQHRFGIQGWLQAQKKRDVRGGDLTEISRHVPGGVCAGEAFKAHGEKGDKPPQAGRGLLLLARTEEKPPKSGA